MQNAKCKSTAAWTRFILPFSIRRLLHFAFCILPSLPFRGVVSVPVTSPALPRRALCAWEWRVIWLLVLCFVCRGLPWRLDDLDQAKQANVSLEIVQAGHWWFQHTPGGKAIATKPPLVGWMSAGVYYFTADHWDIAWRLPSLVAALALAYLLWRVGEILWPGCGGIVAVAAYGYNLLTPRLATLVRTDMPLTFFITAAGLVVWHHARDGGGRPWTNRSRWTVFGLLLAAMMTKGPVVYAFLLPGMLAHGWISRRRGGSAWALWGGWWHWTMPLVPFLVWAGCGMAAVPGFFQEVVLKEFLGRFTVGEHAVHHNQPVTFYLTQMLRQWFPWNVLLLAVTIRARHLWTAVCREPATLWLVCWAAGGFLLMSLVPAKRTDRIFPVLPPLALVTVALLARAQRPDEPAVSAPPVADAVAPPTPPFVPAAPAWPWDWAYKTTLAAVAFGLGSVIYYVVEVYVRHDHARSSFAARALQLEAGKTVGLVVSKNPVDTDETMLVYLHQLAFLSPAEAIQRWSTGKLDAVAINENARTEFGNLLEPFTPTQPVLETAGSKPAYLLLARHTADDKPKRESGPRGH